MGIIKDLMERCDKLQSDNKILAGKIKLLELSLINVQRRINTPSESQRSPLLPNALDSNNIWIGDKGITEYTNLAKLDVHYDETLEKWVAGSNIERIEGEVPILDADKIVTLIWDDVNLKFVAYLNPTYAVYYPG